MAVVVLAIVGGLLAGFAARGSWHRLGQLTLRRPWLLLIALAGQAVSAAGWLDPRLLFGISAAAALAFVAANRGMPGLGLIAIGLTANAVAVIANGGAMPVSLPALGRIDTGLDLGDRFHQPADSHTHLRWLTDQIAVPLPHPFAEVLSAGDVLVAAGCALVCFAAVRGARPAWQTERYGEEGPQAAGTQEQQGQPRQAAERLKRPQQPSPKHRA